MNFDKIKYLDLIDDIRCKCELSELAEQRLDELEEIIEFGDATPNHLQEIEERMMIGAI